MLLEGPGERATGDMQKFHRFTNSTVILKRQSGLWRNVTCIKQIKSIFVELPCEQLYNCYGFLHSVFIRNQLAN